MPEKRKRQVANIGERLAKTIRTLATAENRNFTQQVQTLLKEAIAHRKKNLSVEQIKGRLHQLSHLELAEIIETASQVLQQQIKSASSDVPKVPGNLLAVKTQQNREICQQVFQELEDGDEVLQDIIDGIKPPSEALPLLAMCLSVDLDELENLLDRSFGNEPNHNHHS
jgi:Fe2+ transport system protein B